MNKFYLGNPKDLAQLCGYQGYDQSSKTGHFFLMASMWLNVLRSGQGIPIFDILIVFIILKVKKTTDCLQGISKLDYLLKVSVFQIYKNGDRNLFNSLIFEDSDDESTEAYDGILRNESQEFGT